MVVTVVAEHHLRETPRPAAPAPHGRRPLEKRDQVGGVMVILAGQRGGQGDASGTGDLVVLTTSPTPVDPTASRPGSPPERPDVGAVDHCPEKSPLLAASPGGNLPRPRPRPRRPRPIRSGEASTSCPSPRRSGCRFPDTDSAVQPRATVARSPSTAVFDAEAGSGWWFARAPHELAVFVLVVGAIAHGQSFSRVWPGWRVRCPAVGGKDSISWQWAGVAAGLACRHSVSTPGFVSTSDERVSDVDR
ncbi:hypothetical protein SAMN05444320_102611 [Streptoalloteichus hindustanus]|uniref:Uncharacterized protein n=1 Tax=Streptoalloteichus hindustanus TaxID=2017 RepID=A0A1M4Z5U0_STRHI|nr:hypothetical protein SAMN05444320_102611 [Streptoalloteichus hindustanus]